MEQEPISNVCIVDDDADFVEFLSDYLTGRGLPAKGFGAAEDLLSSGEIGNFDFFILDLGLPGIGGLDLIEQIRAKSQAGIVVISGRMGPDAFNSALSAGADMFVNKPVRFDQVFDVIASVRARASRTAGHSSWILDIKKNQLVAPDGLMVNLDACEIGALRRLSENPSFVVSRKELADASGIICSDGDRSLETMIFHLRRKIEKGTLQPSPLKTVHGQGYKLTKPVKVVE